MKTTIRHFSSAIAAACWLALLFALVFVPAQTHAAVVTWNAASGSEIGVGANWTGGVLPNGATPDIALWNNTPAGALSLIYNTNTLGVSTGILLSNTPANTGSLAIDSGTNTVALRIGGITTASGSGAFTLGDGVGVFNITLGGAAGTQGFTNNSANIMTFESDVAFGLGGGGTHTVALAGPGNFVFSNVINGAINLSKNGIGAATLTAADTYTGTTTVSQGTLITSGGINGTVSPFLVGNVAAQAAAVYQTAGTVAIPGQLQLGSVAGAWGYYNMSGGIINLANGGEIDPGGTSGGAGNIAQWDQSAGTVNVGISGTGPTYFLPSRQGTGQYSVVNFSGSAVVNILNGMADASFAGYECNWGASGTNATTISGSATFSSLSESVKMNKNNNAGNIATLNLNGGIFQTLGFFAAQNLGTIVNFNGGTLKAGNTDNALFSANFYGMYVYGGGATIDDNAHSIAINHSLLAPPGNGVSSIPVASGGAGYIVPPSVAITGGGGSGATAYAQISAAGVVTNVVVTSPGVGYTSTPTVTFGAVGATAVATVGTATTTANTTGSLTKAGTGTLTIGSGGGNTFAGATVNAGTLKVAAPMLYMSFDNVSGSTVINDGNGGSILNGTLTGTASIAVGQGRHGNALTVTGTTRSGGYVLISGNGGPILNVQNGANWSLALWMKTTQTGSVYLYQGGGAWNNTGGADTVMYLGSGTPEVAASSTHVGAVSFGRNFEEGTAVINDGNWHYIVMTCNGSTKVNYVDGVVDALQQNTMVGLAKGSQLWIGGCPAAVGDTGLSALNGGMIDEVSMYNVALSQADVQYMMTNQMPALSAGPVSVATSSKLDLFGVGATATSLTGPGMVDSTLIGGTPTLTISNNANSTFNGALTNTAGTLSVVSSGAGNLTLSGVNGYSGSTTISNGTVTVASTGTLGVNYSGNIINKGIAFTNTSSSAQTYSGTISGSGNLVQNGSSTLTLTGTNNYSGNTIVSAGKLALRSVQTGTGTISVSDGATLQVTAAGTSQLQPTTLSLGTSVGATNSFVAVSSTTTAPLKPGTLSLVGVNVVNISPGIFTAGSSYPLIAYTSETGGGSVVLGTLPNGVTATLVDNGTSLVSLNVSAVQPQIWTGAVNGTWDIGGTANWKQNGVAGTYADQSLTIFDDTGLNPTINVSTTVSPTSMTFSNSSVAYVFTNNPISGAATLTMSGNGTITLSNVNTYSGGTVINNGTLINGVNNAISSNTGDVAVNSPGKIDVHGFNSTVNGLIGSGTVDNVAATASMLTVGNNGDGGTFSGVIKNSSSGALSLVKAGAGAEMLSGPNTYSGNTTVTGGRLAVSGSGTLGSGAGTAMLTNTSGTIDLGGTSQTFSNVVVNSGTVSNGTLIGGSYTLSAANISAALAGSGAAATNLSGATILSATNTFTGNLINGGTLTIFGAGQLGGGTYAGNIGNTLQLTYNSSASQTLSGIISGAGAVSQTGGGALTISGPNTYTGNTTVSGGSLTVNGSGVIPTIGNTVVSGGVLNVSGSASVSPASGTASAILIGNINGQAAALYQSGSTTVSNSSTGGGAFDIGAVPGAVGYYNLSGGTINYAGELDPGGANGGAGTFGEFDMSGGTVNLPNRSAGTYFLPNRGGAGETAVVNVLGGTVQVATGGTPADSTFNGLSVNWQTTGAADVAAITIGGTGQFLTPSLRVKLNQGASFNGLTGNFSNKCALNLNSGGLLQTLGFLNGATNNPNVAVNFNGGTLKAGTAGNTTFLAGLGGAYIFQNGGTIDDNGQAITIGQAISSAPGNGVSSIAVSSAGSGYIAPPIVTISGGGGSNATAYATINATSGAVTGIIVTSPGIGYTGTPTAILTGVGGSGAVAGTVSMAANTSGTLIKQGAGTLTLTNNNTYTNGTAVNGGTLALTGIASISSKSVTVASGAIFDVSGVTAGYTLNNGQSLLGNGAINGMVTALSGSGIYGGTDGGYGTNTFNNNLTNAAGSTINLDLGDAYNLSNDLVKVTGTAIVNGTFHIKAPSTSDNLDTTADYVLLSATALSGTPASTPVFDVAPLNAAHYSVAVSGNTVVLHYNINTLPTAIGSASPSTVARNQSTFISVAVTPGVNGANTPNAISSVTLNATPIGGSAVQPLVSDGAGNYTNTVIVGPGTGGGGVTLVATVTDVVANTGSANISLTITTGNDVWNGLGGDNNFGTGLNWTNGLAPGYVGDSLLFAGVTQTSPNMETNYSVTGVTFDSTAGGFTIGTGNGSTLTLTANGVVNNSTSAQTLNVPVAMSAPQTFNAASGTLTLGQTLANGGNLVTIAGVSNSAVNGAISGGGGLTKNGNGTLTLAGNNTYSGATLVSGGSVTVSGAINDSSLTVNTSTLNLVGAITNSALDTIGGAGGNAVLNIAGGNLQANFASGQLYNSSLNIGSVAGAVGDLQMSSGTLAVLNQLAVGAASYGAFSQGGGTTTIGGFIAIGGTTNGGAFNQSGGTINMTGSSATIGYGAASSVAVMNLSGTAVFNANPNGGAFGGGIWPGEVGTGVLNVSGSASLVIPADSLILGKAGGSGTANLLGGTITANAVSKGTGTGVLNFNGGTLKANLAGTAFMTGLNSANVFTGGAVIDDGGNAITIGQPLLAPSGSGVSSITTNGLTSSGYIDTPVVQITGGGGANATAVAQINSSGVITNFVVTSPGTGYTSTPTITIVGVGGSVSGVATITTAANTGGGLTKQGSGTLKLTGANTYSGSTTISAGTLALSGSGSIANTPQLSIASGATFDVSALSGFNFTGSGPAQNLAGSANSGTANIIATGNTVTLASGATASFHAVGGGSPTTGKISVAGGLSLNGNVITITVDSGVLGAGTYRLLDCTDTLTGSANPTPTITGSGSILPGAVVSISTTSGAGGHVDLVVSQATPVLQTLPTASAITYGQALSASTLSGGAFTNAAGAAVSGSFAFAALSTIPTAGTTNPAVIFTPTDTANYNSVNFNVSVTVNQATTSITVQSSANPTGNGGSVYFVATNLPGDATGSVVFLTNGVVFDTETLSGGVASSLSTTSLPRGTNAITVQYAGDANYLGSTNDLAVGQVVTNHPPVVNTAAYVRPAGYSYKLALATLSTNWTDADGDAMALTNGVGSTNGAVVSYDTNYVYYSNSNNVADQVSYTVDDGHGGLTAGVFNLTIAPATTNVPPNITGIVSVGGNVTISFASVPNSTNVVEWTTNLATQSWTAISTNLAGTNGLWSYTDTNPPSPSFYRSQRQP